MKTSEFSAASRSRFPCFILHYAWESKDLHKAVKIINVQCHRPDGITLRATTRCQVVFTDLVITRTMVNEYKGMTYKCQRSSNDLDFTT
jgi:DUF1365 family protein